MVAAVDGAGGSTATPEACTVRPDPYAFPRSVPQSARQWQGLSDRNGGTGDLWNVVQRASLQWAYQRFGVDLDWTSSPARWKIQANGGIPRVMRGQPVALRVWGGGWLAYGYGREWGLELVLLSTPQYEWYVLGGAPGSSIEHGGTFALWNSAAQAYLVRRHQTFGVDLDLDPAPPEGETATPRLVRTTVRMRAATVDPLTGYVEMWSVFGGPATEITNPPGGPTLLFVKPGYGFYNCDDPKAVIRLAAGATMFKQDVVKLSEPEYLALGRRGFVACAPPGTTTKVVDLSVFYRDF